MVHLDSCVYRARDFMTSKDAMVVQGAILPFVMPWQGLDPNFEVVSLDVGPQEWATLLAGQGIGLRIGSDLVPKDCSVATGFDTLNTMTPQALGTWASEVVQVFRPGGLLVLGGTNPDHPESRNKGLFPTEVVQILKKSGFARVRVIQPISSSEEASLFSALYPNSKIYAVVAQTEAYGKAFDVFSAAFSDAPVFPLQDCFRHAEAALNHRIHRSEAAALRVCAEHITLRARAEHVEAILQDQRHEITQLRAVLARLQRTTRRRGLRKLIHKVKQKWHASHQPNVPLPSFPHKVDAPLSVHPLPTPPVHQVPTQSANPAPLSSCETAIHERLFSLQKK
jgi:hypothetical protein